MSQQIEVLQSKINELWVKGETNPEVFVSSFLTDEKGKRISLEDISAQRRFFDAVLSGKFKEAWFAGGNSSGKTWTGALLGTFAAFYKIKPDFKWKSYALWERTPFSILCTGGEQKQALEMWEIIEGFIRRNPFLGKQVKITGRTFRETHPTIQIPKINVTIDAIGLHDKGKRVEGESYDWILINEPVDVKHLQEVVEKTLTQRLWRRGGVMCGFGTPKGIGGDYYRLAVRGIKENDDGTPNPKYDEKVYTQFADSTKNPYADQGRIKEFLNTKDKELINERILGKFVNLSETAFPYDKIASCAKEYLPKKIGYSSRLKVIHGLDFGRKNDFTVMVSLDTSFRPYTLVNFYRAGGGWVGWEEIFSDVKKIYDEYGGEVFVDSTSAGGDMQTTWLADLDVFFTPYSSSGSPAKKVALINTLQKFITEGKIQFSDQLHQLVEELRLYPRDMKDEHYDTDCVMALALACMGIETYGDSESKVEVLRW